jgi:predicted RNase H-like nuclease
LRIRKQLIENQYGSELFPQIRAQHPRSVVAGDDIVDSFAALWSAIRIYSGVGVFIPDPPEVDSTGLRMVIVY